MCFFCFFKTATKERRLRESHFSVQRLNSFQWMTSNLTNVLEAASHEKNFDKKKLTTFVLSRGVLTQNGWNPMDRRDSIIREEDRNKREKKIQMFTNILLFKTWCFRRFHNHQTWDSFRWRSVASRKPLASIWVSRSLSSSRYLQWGEPDNTRERGCFRLIVSLTSLNYLRLLIPSKALTGKW